MIFSTSCNIYTLNFTPLLGCLCSVVKSCPGRKKVPKMGPKKDQFLFAKKGQKTPFFVEKVAYLQNLRSRLISCSLSINLSDKYKQKILNHFLFLSWVQKQDQVSEKGTKTVRFQPTFVISPKKGPVCFFRDLLNHTANEMIWV